MSDVPEPEKPALRLVKAELEAPEEVGGGPESAQEPPPGPDPAGGKPPRKRRPERPPGEIWAGCPVEALGVQGKNYYYLDYLRQLATVDGHTKDRMRGVFGGRSDLLQREFPQYSKSGDVSGWAQEKAATAMMLACTEKGVWNALERVRGIGAWTDGDGGVVLHCGDQVLVGGAWRETGGIDGHVYPSGPPIPRPLGPREAAPKGDMPATQLVDLLATWSWLRGDIDAWLLTGWICAAMFGGALEWRPLVWITGDAGTGKSTVQRLIRAVIGEGGILQATDATEAGIRQFLMQSTIPVALDELEAEADGRKAEAIVKLARQAASGGVVLRGGADHVGQEFRARSCFAFSSILIPRLLDQDISRIAVLDLSPLPRDVVPPAIDVRHWAHVGRALRAQILGQWPRMVETIERYRLALARVGHSARGCDQYGTLLGMADLAMYDSVPDDARCDRLAAQLSAAAIADQTDQLTDWQRCVSHLFGQHIEPYRSGQRFPVGRWVLAAAGLREEPKQGDAAEALPSFGMKVDGRGVAAELIVSNTHSAIGGFYRDTHWAAGVWRQAFKRIPGAAATGALSFDGATSRAYKFKLSAIPNLFDDRPPQPAPEPAYSPEDFA